MIEESEKTARKFISDSKTTSSYFLENFSNIRPTINNDSNFTLTSDDIALRKKTVQSQIDEAKYIFSKALSSSTTRFEEARSLARTRILQTASVIATTLSGSGNEFISRLESASSSSNSLVSASALTKLMLLI